MSTPAELHTKPQGGDHALSADQPQEARGRGRGVGDGLSVDVLDPVEIPARMSWWVASWWMFLAFWAMATALLYLGEWLAMPP